MKLREIESGQSVYIIHHMKKGTTLAVQGKVDLVRHYDYGVEIDFPGYVTEYYDEDKLEIYLLSEGAE